MTAELGLLGLAALSALILVAVVTTVGAVRRAGPGGRSRALVAAPAAGLAAVLGQGLVDDPLRNPVLATTVWLFIGFLAAETQK